MGTNPFMNQADFALILRRRNGHLNPLGILNTAMTVLLRILNLRNYDQFVRFAERMHLGLVRIAFICDFSIID